MKEGICIFGGSFDPVHKGHRKLALFIAESLNVRKMLIIPAFMSPFKNSSGSTPEDRMEMCKLCFHEEIFSVSDIEIKRGGKSYTVDTVNAVKKLYSDEKIYLLIGSDQLLSFDKWYSFEEILSNVTLVSVSRESSVDKARLEQFCDSKLRTLGECKILDFSPLEISSTEIRRAVKSGSGKEFLSPEVFSYIQKKGLYKDE